MSKIRNSGLLSSLLDKKEKGHTVPSIDDLVLLCNNTNHNMRRGLAQEVTQSRINTEVFNINTELSQKVLDLQNWGSQKDSLLKYQQEEISKQGKSISDLQNCAERFEEGMFAMESKLALQSKTISELTNRIQSLEDAIGTLSTVKKEIVPPAATQEVWVPQVGDLCRVIPNGALVKVVFIGEDGSIYAKSSDTSKHHRYYTSELKIAKRKESPQPPRLSPLRTPQS